MMSEAILGSTGEVRAARTRRAWGRLTGGAACLFTVLMAPSVHADEGPKQMDWEQPVQCLRDGKIVRVSSEILRRSGPPVPVDYLFRETPDGWLAFDVIVEGVSYVQTYRSQFDELLRTESVDSLTAKLAAGKIQAGG